jgi:hypothetical protein
MVLPLEKSRLQHKNSWIDWESLMKARELRARRKASTSRGKRTTTGPTANGRNAARTPPQPTPPQDEKQTPGAHTTRATPRKQTKTPHPPKHQPEKRHGETTPNYATRTPTTTTPRGADQSEPHESGAARQRRSETPKTTNSGGEGRLRTCFLLMQKQLKVAFLHARMDLPHTSVYSTTLFFP